MSEADLEFWTLVWWLFAIVGAPVAILAPVGFAFAMMALNRKPPRTAHDDHR